MAHLLKVCVKETPWTRYQVCVNGHGYLRQEDFTGYGTRFAMRDKNMLDPGELVYGYHQAMQHIMEVREDAPNRGEYAAYWENVPLDIEETTGTTRVYALMTIYDLEELVRQAGYDTANIFWDLDNDVPEYIVMEREIMPGAHEYAQVQDDGTINGEPVYKFFANIGRQDILRKRYAQTH